MQPWQVILIIVIYDITKGLCTEFLNWKNELSSTASEINNIVLDREVHIPNKATNGNVMEQDSTTKNDFEVYINKVLKAYKEGVPVAPQEHLYPDRIPRCNKCKWWKDSDGKYRRGCGAESKCPINTHTVYRGEGYCYMFSPKVDYNKEIE